MTMRRSNDVDAIVGRNIRVHRLAKDLSQTELGNKLGVSFQQVQKYESGSNRVGSGRLFQISTILGVPLLSFFDGARRPSAAPRESPFDVIADPLSLRLLQAFARISHSRTRQSLVTLIESVARKSRN